MKKMILALALGLASIFTSTVQADMTSGSPNGISVGTFSGSSRVILTGTTKVYKELELLSIINGDSISVPADSVITTALFVGTATGVSNTTVLKLPAELEGPDLTSGSFTVPMNYGSGGAIEVRLHLSGSITQGQVSMTADVYINATLAGVTSLAKTAGTAIQVSPTAETVFTWTTLTNAAAFAAGDRVNVKFGKTGTTRSIEIADWRFRYKPYGVLNTN